MDKTEKENENSQILVKRIGGYKIDFYTKFNHRESDRVFLVLECNPELKALLNKAIVEKSEIDFKHYLGYDENDNTVYSEYKRFKVKTWIYSGLFQRSREFLFIKEFVENGKIAIPFLDKSILDEFLSDVKANIKNLVETIEKYTNLKVSVIYELGKE